MIHYDLAVEKYGYPLYIYAEKELKKRTEILKDIFEGFSIFYSLKANPNKRIISTLASLDIGADCASANEVLLARECGINKGNILYSTPGKTYEDFELSCNDSTIIADSLGELERLNDFFSEKADIGVRINPTKGLSRKIAFETMGGVSSKFGIDESTFFTETQRIRKYKNISIVGLHVYIGSGILDESVILSNFENIFDIASRFDTKLKFIDFGGGLGIPYEPGQRELDTRQLKEGIKKLIKRYDYEDTRLIIESGRYISATCGRYITRITDIKESLGKIYYIIHGGMNGFFRPTFTETKHKIISYGKSNEKETVTVAGHLCTPIDVMATDVEVTKAQVGDLLEVSDAGAYGYSMSLKEFISHRKPIELYLDQEGKIHKC